MKCGVKRSSVVWGALIEKRTGERLEMCTQNSPKHGENSIVGGILESCLRSLNQSYMPKIDT